MRQRLERHLLAQLVALGEHSLSGLLATAGRLMLDWSADYRMYSRCRIDPQRLFAAVRAALLAQHPADEPLLVAIDDTRVRKRGLRVAGARWARDPLGPRFQLNLIWAQRFVQTSLGCGAGAAARLVPIDWEHAPSVKKPAAAASDAERKAYREACRRQSLGRVASGRLRDLRQWLDESGNSERALCCVVDGGYTNSSLLKNLPERTHLIGRIRADAKLHHLPLNSAGRGRKRVYGEIAPTPEQLRQDEGVPYQTVRVWIGAALREARVKTLGPLRWRPAGAGHDLLLLVIAPLCYRVTPGGKHLYRKPAYLIATDPGASVEQMVQSYIRRSDIETNFRDEKTLLGVGEAQVRDGRAVQNVTAMQVAAYALLLAAAQQVSPCEDACVLPRPKWQRRAPQRATTPRLIQQLRYELWGETLNFSGFAAPNNADTSPEKIPISPFSALFYASRYS